MNPDEVLFWGLGVLARLMLYSGLLMGVGSAVVHLISPEHRDEVNHSLRLSLRVGAALVCSSLVVDLASNVISAFGFADALSVESIKIMAMESRWGGRWRPQFLVSIVTLVLVLIPGRLRAWPLLPLGVIIVLRAASGHAAAASWWVAGLQSLHILAAGCWIGTLFVLLRTRASDIPLLASRDVLDRFSRVALASASSIAVSGCILAIAYIPTLAMMLEMWYGRLIILKIGLLIGVGAFGAYNWRVLTPRMGEDGAERQLLRSARFEVAVACLILLASSVVVVLPHD